MRLHKYQSFLESTKSDIDSICKKYGIQNYTINDDGSIDVDGNVNLEGKGLSKLPLNFRNVTGYFSCSDNQLTSLDGCLKSVGRFFHCSHNQLTTLEGCPKSVYDFDCSHNQLASLKGSPRIVGGYFYCHNNKLTDLEGGPQIVDGDFVCIDNQLTTLEGGPQSLGGGFFCRYNQLTTLEGGPQTVGGHFSCSDNQLTTLEGCPKSVGSGFDCSRNQLTTLEGGPKTVGDYFDCEHNQLIDLKGFPEFWEGDFYYSDNPLGQILDQFPQDKVCKAIHWINEYEVIQNGEVISDRMEEVYYELGLDTVSENMRFIKTFENFNEDSDEDLFFNYLEDVTDNNDLYEIKDTQFLRGGYLFITSDNFQEGYFYKSSGPIDRDSSSINTNRSWFSVTILKRSYEGYPAAMSSDEALNFLKKEYPKLYSDLDNYIKQMKSLHKVDEFNFSHSLRAYLISGGEFKFYEIELTFKLRKLKVEETPKYRTTRMLKQLNLGPEYKTKLKEIGYDLDESIENEDYIDKENTESAFLDIKDEFDLTEISYEDFYYYMIHLGSIKKIDFSDSYMINTRKGDRSNPKFLNTYLGYVSISILIKSKYNAVDVRNDKVEELISSEYPNLQDEIKNLIYIVEKSEGLKSYKHIVLRECLDFSLYHICISFSPEVVYNQMQESIKVKNITSEDVIKSIKGGGRIFATAIKDLIDNDPEEALTPVSIDDDGLVTIDFKGKEYEVELRNIDKIDIPLNENYTIDQRNENFKIFYNEDYSKEGNSLRDEILDHIEDVLYHFSDEDYSIEVGYGYTHTDELEFKLKPNKCITEVDMNYIQILNDYLKVEGFIPIQSNILGELDIHVYFERKQVSYPLPRLKYMIGGGLLARKIEFKFKIPII